VELVELVELDPDTWHDAAPAPITLAPNLIFNTRQIFKNVINCSIFFITLIKQGYEVAVVPATFLKCGSFKKLMAMESF
jgi:hypothetical protein